MLTRGSLQGSYVATDLLQRPGGEIGKLGPLGAVVAANEAAFLEHSRRGGMLGMAQGDETPHADSPGDLHHRPERLRGIAAAPRILGQDVAGHRLGRGHESEPGASDQLTTLAQPDQVGAGRPLHPLSKAEAQECAGIVNRPMPRPTEKARVAASRVARVPLEHCVGIVQGRRRLGSQAGRVETRKGAFITRLSGRAVPDRRPWRAAKLADSGMYLGKYYPTPGRRPDRHGTLGCGGAQPASYVR